MTPADWNAVEAALSLPDGPGVKLRCDGYELSLLVVAVKPLQYGIHIWVDGQFKGAWCSARNPSEQQRRFCRPVHRPLHRPDQLASMKRVLSAQTLRKMKDARYTYYTGLWPSFAPLKRHLLANNTSIELVERELLGDAVRVAESALDLLAETLA